MPCPSPNLAPEREAFTLPDFVSTCPFPLAINPYYQPASSKSEEWLAEAGVHPNEAHKRAFRACNFGLLTAMCYTSASVERFRILCDFINCLFAFDDLTDEGGLRKDDDGTKRANQIVVNALMDPFGCTTEFRVGEVIRDFWGRAISIGCFEGTRRRFIESTELYLAAVHQQVEKRRTGVIPNLEDYILLRRDTGALKMCFAMGEFGLNLSIPDAVFENDLMKTMQDCANDVVVLSNDIYSWNIEQAQGETCNIISVSMREKGLTIQSAMDFAGRLVFDRIELYLNCKAKLPSYGPAVDREVLGYMRVMEDWMRGGFDWSLESHRYFGDQVSEVKATLSVKLLPFEEKIVKPELIPVA